MLKAYGTFRTPSSKQKHIFHNILRRGERDKSLVKKILTENILNLEKEADIQSQATKQNKIW
jgi:hypothetical protein